MVGWDMGRSERQREEAKALKSLIALSQILAAVASHAAANGWGALSVDWDLLGCER